MTSAPMERRPSLQILRYLDRVDMWKMPRQAFPLLAFVSAGPHFAICRPEVESDRLVRVRGHRLPLHGHPGVFLWKAFVLTLPALTRVVGHVCCRSSIRTRARPNLSAVHWKHPGCVGFARMKHHRKAYVAYILRHVLADS